MPLATNALTDGPTIQRALQLSDSDYANHIADIERWINGSTAYLEQVLGRKIKSRTYTDDPHDGNGAGVLLLKQYPVTALTGLTIWSNDFLTSYVVDTTSSENKVRYIPESGELILLPKSDIHTFLRGRQNVLVTYTAGFQSEVDIEPFVEAAISMVSYQWAAMGQDPTISGESYSGYSYTRAFDSVPSSVMAVIKGYSRLEV